MRLFIACFSVLGSAYLGWIAWLQVRRSHDLITPETVLIGLAVLDVFAAALRFAIAGAPTVAPWQAQLKLEAYAYGLIVFAISLGLLLAGYRVAAGKHHRSEQSVAAGELLNMRPVRGRVYALMGLSLLAYLGSLAAQVKQSGSLGLYVRSRVTLRYVPGDIEGRGLLGAFTNYLNSASMLVFLMLLGVLFFYRHECGRRRLWGVVFPIVGWTLSATTFYRGSQLSFFLALACIETVRMSGVRARADRTERHAANATRAISLLAIAGVTFFAAYGALRFAAQSQLNEQPVDATAAVSAQVGEFTRGHGLVGVTEIVQRYPRELPHLSGRSLASSLLFPVPRAVWGSKPDLYGFLDVSADLGWPASTQTAITAPGELWANFGPWGLTAMFAIGLALGRAYRARLGPGRLFAYAFALIPGIIIFHWMSLLGLMNLLIYVPLLVLVSHLVITYPSRSRADDRASGQRHRIRPAVATRS